MIQLKNLKAYFGLGFTPWNQEVDENWRKINDHMASIICFGPPMPFADIPFPRQIGIAFLQPGGEYYVYDYETEGAPPVSRIYQSKKGLIASDGTFMYLNNGSGWETYAKNTAVQQTFLISSGAPVSAPIPAARQVSAVQLLSNGTYETYEVPLGELLPSAKLNPAKKGLVASDGKFIYVNTGSNWVLYPEASTAPAPYVVTPIFTNAIPEIINKGEIDGLFSGANFSDTNLPEVDASFISPAYHGSHWIFAYMSLAVTYNDIDYMIKAVKTIDKQFSVADPIFGWRSNGTGWDDSIIETGVLGTAISHFCRLVYYEPLFYGFKSKADDYVSRLVPLIKQYDIGWLENSPEIAGNPDFYVYMEPPGVAGDKPTIQYGPGALVMLNQGLSLLATMWNITKYQKMAGKPVDQDFVHKFESGISYLKSCFRLESDPSLGEVYSWNYTGLRTQQIIEDSGHGGQDIYFYNLAAKSYPLIFTAVDTQRLARTTKRMLAINGDVYFRVDGTEPTQLPYNKVNLGYDWIDFSFIDAQVLERIIPAINQIVYTGGARFFRAAADILRVKAGVKFFEPDDPLPRQNSVFITPQFSSTPPVKHPSIRTTTSTVYVANANPVTNTIRFDFDRKTTSPGKIKLSLRIASLGTAEDLAVIQQNSVYLKFSTGGTPDHPLLINTVGGAEKTGLDVPIGVNYVDVEINIPSQVSYVVSLTPEKNFSGLNSEVSSSVDKNELVVITGFSDVTPVVYNQFPAGLARSSNYRAYHVLNFSALNVLPLTFKVDFSTTSGDAVMGRDLDFYYTQDDGTTFPAEWAQLNPPNVIGTMPQATVTLPAFQRAGASFSVVLKSNPAATQVGNYQIKITPVTGFATATLGFATGLVPL